MLSRVGLYMVCCQNNAIFASASECPAVVNLYIMAIIKSMGVGRARKSMGNVTYRTVRGRTIGSQKRSEGVTGVVTRGLSGNYRKPLFAMINQFMKQHASDIEVSFNKSKYGSQRNYFFTSNYAGLKAALEGLALAAAGSGELPPYSDIEAAITTYATQNPSSIYRVKLAGFDNVFLTGTWSSDDNPISGGAVDGLGSGTATTRSGDATYTAPTLMSLNFHTGAKIVRDAGTVTLTGSAIPSNVTASDIKYLTNGGSELSITVTDVVSAAGSLSYSAPALLESSNILGVRVKGVFIRLSSAYVTQDNEQNPNPLG